MKKLDIILHTLTLTLATLGLVGLLLRKCSAEDQPAQRNLDPNKPADAVMIVDTLTKDLTLPRHQAVILTVAIETLRRAVAVQTAKPETTKDP